jgi:hypothetical protein
LSNVKHLLKFRMGNGSVFLKHVHAIQKVLYAQNLGTRLYMKPIVARGIFTIYHSELIRISYI